MRTKTRWAFRGLAIAAAGLATVQPLLGSFAFFRGGEQIDLERIHLIVGGILYNLAIALTVVAPFTRFRRRWIVFSLCAFQYVLLHVQLRLGLGSNEDAALLAYHIPLGVLIFFVSYLTVAAAFGVRLDSTRT